MRALRLSLLCIAGLALAGLAFPREVPAQGAGAQPVNCGESVQFSLGATSTAIIVPAVLGQGINICGIVLNTGAAAATYQLTAGTGTNCNANTITITPAFSLPANGVMVMQNTTAWFSTPTYVPNVTPQISYALCHTITGTGPMNVIVQFNQP